MRPQHDLGDAWRGRSRGHYRPCLPIHLTLGHLHSRDARTRRRPGCPPGALDHAVSFVTTRDRNSKCYALLISEKLQQSRMRGRLKTSNASGPGRAHRVRGHLSRKIVVGHGTIALGISLDIRCSPRRSQDSKSLGHERESEADRPWAIPGDSENGCEAMLVANYRMVCLAGSSANRPGSEICTTRELGNRKPIVDTAPLPRAVR